MPDIAEKIETLPDDLRSRAEGYVDALCQLAAQDRRRFTAAIEVGLADLDAGRTHSDEDVWQRLEAHFGPLEEPTTP